jgi:sugar lactone lactonase YvrE
MPSAEHLKPISGAATMIDVEHYLSIQNELGETPIWVPDEKLLYWVDIGSHMIFRIDPKTNEYKTFEPDMPVRGLCRRSSGNWLVITDAGLAFWDRSSNSCEFIADPYADQPDLQFNDGAIDRQGRLLVGSFNSVRPDSPDGSLYRLDSNRTLHKLDQNLVLSNGIAISPDGETVYVSEMRANKITAYDYNIESGTAGNRRVFVAIPEDAGKPDGLTVDSQGFVWAAHWGGWRVTRYDPAGKLEREIRIPTENATCIGFGGENLNELFITTAWYDLSDQQRQDQPLAGDLFRIQTDITGIAEPVFDG